MICDSVDSCFGEISAYFKTDISGYPLLVNVDDSDMLQNIVSKLQADSSKTIIKVSDFCKDDYFPNIDNVLEASVGDGAFILLGLSQIMMLRGEHELKQLVAKVLQLPIKGHLVILLNHCSGILKNHISLDLRLEHRVIIINCNEHELPKIKLAKSEKECFGITPCKNIQALMQKLESITKQETDKNPEITVVTCYSPELFGNSMYSVSACDGIYETIAKAYRTVALSTEKEWGTEYQWKDLAEKLKKYKTISAVIDDIFGSTINLQSHIEDIFDDLKSINSWYLWLGMKSLGIKGNKYLEIAVKESSSVDDFVKHVYMDLLKVNISSPDFMQLYLERKKIIEKMPENITYVQKYCEHVGQAERNAVYYITDLTLTEKRKFLKLISEYDYTEEELNNVTQNAFPELYLYLKKFTFNENNTKISDVESNIHCELTDYFQKYKIQKIINRIFPDFLETVRKNAVDRPFNKILPRSSIMMTVAKENAQVHFFDALGVEYLSYIVSKCNEYGLVPEVHIAHCELPSITENNLEFKKYFKLIKNADGDDVLPGTKELDKLKHHSTIVDYTKCSEPIHLFMELDIIDEELRKIYAMLSNGEFDKIIIVSDHGASRLAVINERENPLLDLGEKSEHSGRCCKTDFDPRITEATYENGYAILANYERFKGGRAANVEVHGGATLEEALVPIIIISKMPENREIYLINSFIELHAKDIVEIIVYSNISVSMPKLLIKETYYDSNKRIDDKHYKFVITDIKRSGKFTAILYDGDKQLSDELIFQVKKGTSTERQLF